MRTRKPRAESPQHLRQLRRQLKELDASPRPNQQLRAELLRDIRLAKGNLRQPAKSARRPARRKPVARPRPKSRPATVTPAKKNHLGDLLTPKNIQESIKSVGSLRNTVKNWMKYLQQADQILDTLFVTSNSLRESGVLDKLVKNKGKNLTTEDFTNVLMALMNSPLGSQVLGGRSEGGETSSQDAAANTPKE
ncbi:hypothetical protein JI721_05960 [Alicyclobacillus cycloheptanicus]|uniref:Uncharacterized protein n=1 Tax=Alicyclobacillus cycloheptanicus TaxID=1457 RepID=A0ABT9XMN0_9BACL|nr:hypothetical protein [Alicyclobacillus cycloheptanicus]MDQ0191390.1 hypothetical protein [Alicyclobacillus cycloheptanicus]WDM02350.1 hypothetical protein JI721_05960 [Alicyclobacillus cycloheptanicus]